MYLKSPRVMKLVIIFGFILCLLPAISKATENGMLPEWVIDTIILPVKQKDYLGSSIFVDDNKRMVILYSEPAKKNRVFTAIDLFTHQEVDALLADHLSHLGKGNYNGWQRLNKDLLHLTYKNPSRIFNTPYSVSYEEARGGSKCGTPYTSYIKIYRDEKEVGGYYLIFTNKSKKFYFHTGPYCWGMDGKESIWLKSEVAYPKVWPINDDKLLITGSDMPYFILIQANRISEALKETKTLVFNKGGVRGYWVKYELLEEWIKTAENAKESNNKRKRLLEYIDEYITKELSR
jgi:hypothetical protein